MGNEESDEAVENRKESIKSIKFIKSVRSMDPCGALCLRQLELPNLGIDNPPITE